MQRLKANLTPLLSKANLQLFIVQRNLMVQCQYPGARKTRPRHLRRNQLNLTADDSNMHNAKRKSTKIIFMLVHIMLFQLLIFLFYIWMYYKRAILLVIAIVNYRIVTVSTIFIIYVFHRYLTFDIKSTTRKIVCIY